MVEVILAALAVGASWLGGLALLLGWWQLMDYRSFGQTSPPYDFYRFTSGATVFMAIAASLFAWWSSSRDVSQTFIYVEASLLALPTLAFVIMLIRIPLQIRGARQAEEGMQMLRAACERVNAQSREKLQDRPEHIDEPRADEPSADWELRLTLKAMNLPLRYTAWILLAVAPPLTAILHLE